MKKTLKTSNKGEMMEKRKNFTLLFVTCSLAVVFFSPKPRTGLKNFYNKTA